MRMGAGRLAVGLGAAILLLAGGFAANHAEAQIPKPPPSRAPRPGLSQKQEDDLAHKHDGYYGALAPQNLHRKRPKPPFDMTGTWFVNLRHAFNDFMFGPPYPEFLDAGKQAMVEAAAAREAHKSYRDSIGQCFPAGMPMIMTRVWP